MSDLASKDYAGMISDEALSLPPDEYQLWVEAQEDPPMPRPSEWPLGSNEGRYGFLESYIWFGEAALFEAVGHMWNSLKEPKNLLCIYIGMFAGTGGSGKWALAKFLRRALRETLDFDGPQPWGGEYRDIHEFHAAAMDYFAADRAHYERTIQKYADILNGEPGRHAVSNATILKGPWRALEGSAHEIALEPSPAPNFGADQPPTVTLALVD